MRAKRISLFVPILVISGFAVAQGQEASGVDSVYFIDDVMPLVSKLGCNQTKCHGSLKGQGGFRLSMFAAEPEDDFAALAKSTEARRVNPVEPGKSLFLLKATSSIPHEGGQRVQVGSPEYNVLASWVAQGAPWGDEQAPKLVSVTVIPEEQVLQKGEAQQLSATAVFSDGSQKDVTHRAVYTSSEERVAAVDGTGKVQASDFGESHVVVTYLRQTDTVRIVVPQPLPSPFPNVAPNNKIDEFVFAKLQKLGIPPSELCSDHEFLRRIYLDAIGTLPTPDEARAFLADTDPQKRSKLVDRLLTREEFADFWALKWGDLLRIKTGVGVTRPAGAGTYYRWVRESIAQNMPYDQFARELVTASGSNYELGAANFFTPASNKDTQSFAEAAALIFMGARIGCARCHGHPVESWALDDDLGLAAFFATVSFKNTREWTEEIVFSNPKKTLPHPKTGQVVKPKFLGGEVLELDGREDPRVRFAEWLISPQNPWFAKNIVNRVWFWLLGRGIVHEADDLRSTNPPENPEILQYLQEELVSQKYDLKHIFRLILNSKTYQLSSQPNQWNEEDVAHFSHYRAKRLGAEQLLDAVSEVTETWERFNNTVAAPNYSLPLGHKAKRIPDGSTDSPFLKLFGRAARDTSFESQRTSPPSVQQALYLLNSDEFQAKVVSSPRIHRLIQEQKSDAEAIDELYLVTLARAPTEQEKTRLLDYMLGESKPAIEQAAAEKQAADEALAKVKGDLEKAKADYEAAEKAAQEAETAAANAKTAADSTAAAQANAEKDAAAKRQQANESKKTVDDLVEQQQKPAEANVAAAAQAVTDATTAKVAADKALAEAQAATANAQQAYEAAEKAAQEAEATAKAISEDAGKSEEEKKKAADEAAARRKAADEAKTALTQTQEKEQPAQTQANTAAQKLAEAEAQKKPADEALANVTNQVAAASNDHQAAEKAAAEAETAAAAAKAEADKARATQATAEKDAPEKRKLAGEAKARQDQLVTDEQAANAKVAEATTKVDAANAAHQKSRLPALQDVLWALLNTEEFMVNH